MTFREEMSKPPSRLKEAMALTMENAGRHVEMTISQKPLGHGAWNACHEG